mmetsp:Transcript_12790/g.34410  ORF Transcript_12790/g.34410 Transcript_12790/m.34410 type:complete len:270 (+) Transcript_12790:165-974(+)|eukprot:CAMPEP_0185833674 /NCGR_PEP_ID=MMETSP1353-20130828/3309_1 /TAXON_ID=1077150 /ORGANISM="Erythrolobus australicus, Strain CCMP3124" /LENGTH=269 /DNA_ID=CAMNT_0028531989 /DNA_START=158 /DNA_END=967 /DNA_ORIENTATION=+
MTDSLINQALGVVVVAAYALSTVYFLINLGSAWSEVSLWNGAFAEIFASKWATATLVDYVAGAYFTGTYLVLREKKWWKGVLWAWLSYTLGNPVLLLYASIKIAAANFNIVHGILGIRTEENERSRSAEDLLQLEERRPQDENNWSSRFFTGTLCAVLAVYIIVCMNALWTESFREGMRYVVTHKWAYTTFLDNVLGILFSMTFIAAREHPRWLNIAAIWIALAICGNAVTLIYALSIFNSALSSGVPPSSAFFRLRTASAPSEYQSTK